MDPGGIGALIGCSIIAGIGITTYCCDLYKKRKQAKLIKKGSIEKLIDKIPEKKETTPILIVRSPPKKLKEYMPK